MRYNRKQALLIIAVLMFIIFAASAFATSARTQASTGKQGGGTTESTATPMVSTQTAQRPINMDSLDYCSQTIAAQMWKDGVDTRKELNASGVNGRPHEILMTKIIKKEQQEKKAAEAKRRALAKRQQRQTSSVARAPKGSYSGNGAGIIRQVGASKGCSGAEIQMLLYIAQHESGLRCNAVSRTGKYVGLFQLGPHLGSYEQRLDPVWNTSRAIRYMRGRYGSIAAAYNFKRANGWY